MLAHRTRRAAAVLATLAVLSGCDSNPSPAPLPSESPSPSSSSPSPTATPPTLPAAAKGTSEASAKAFVRHWVATLNYAGETGDTTTLRLASDKDCTSCQGVISKIDDVYSADGYFKGDGWSIATMKYQPLQPPKRPVLTVGVNIASQTVVERAGAEPTGFDGGKRSMTFRLAFSDRDWRVMQLDQPQ